LVDGAGEEGSVVAGCPGTPRLLRAINDRAALALLLAHGPLSRTTLGNLTGLSNPTTSQLLAVGQRGPGAAERDHRRPPRFDTATST